MKRRVMQVVQSKRLARINTRKREVEQRLTHALSVPEISTAQERYINMRFDAAKGADESEVSAALENYRNALTKHGYSESDFEYTPLCPICEDKGVVNGKLCKCVWKEFIRALKAECDIERKAPFTFADCDLDTVNNATQRNTLEQLYGFMQKYAAQLPLVHNLNIVLSGGVGSGKTCLASAVARAAADRGKSCLFMSAYEFNGAMLACHTSPISERNARMHDIITADLLVIDDLGTEPFLKNVTEEYLLLILEERHNAHLCTIITTNLNSEQLLTRYHERIYSRLSHKRNSMFFVIDGDDLRHNL